MNYVSGKSLRAVAAPSTSLSSAILNVEAQEKRGKTKLCLSAPGPIAYLNLDRKADYLIAKAVEEGKQVIKRDYHYRPPVSLLKEQTGKKELGALVNEIAKGARPIWDRLEKDFVKFVGDDSIRSIVLDNSSQFYRLRRWAKFGRLAQVPPLMNQEINAEMLWFFTVGRDHPEKNFLYVHRLTDEWVNVKKADGKGTVGEKTGRLVRDGWKDAGYEVDATVRLDKVRRQGAWVFTAEITDSGYEGLGETFEDEEIDFATICASVFGTTPKEWRK